MNQITDIMTPKENTKPSLIAAFKKQIPRRKYIYILASFSSVSMANAAVTMISASDATYIRSGDGQAGTNFNSSVTNVANNNTAATGTSEDHRIALYTYDLSAITVSITDVTWSLTENAGGASTNTYAVTGIGDGTINLGTITWTTAVSGGFVASNLPVGTALGTFPSVDGTASYDVTLSTAFFDGDADGLVTLAIHDTNPDASGIGWTDAPVLNVTSVPEPSSIALLGLGGGLALLRRKRS